MRWFEYRLPRAEISGEWSNFNEASRVYSTTWQAEIPVNRCLGKYLGGSEQWGGWSEKDEMFTEWMMRDGMFSSDTERQNAEMKNIDVQNRFAERNFTAIYISLIARRVFTTSSQSAFLQYFTYNPYRYMFFSFLFFSFTAYTQG